MARTLRSLPGYQIRDKLRRAGYRQCDVARQAKVSDSFVSIVLSRRAPADSSHAERVWRAIEAILARGAGA